MGNHSQSEGNTFLKNIKNGTVSFLSDMFFCSMLPLLWQNRSKDITIDDLKEISKNSLSDKLGDEIEKNWFLELEKALKNGRKPKLLKVLLKTFLMGFLFDGFLTFVLTMICKPFTPVLLALLISEFNTTDRTKSKAGIYAIALIVLSFLGVFLLIHSLQRNQRRGMRIRVACCSLLYRKMLRLSSAALNQTTAGQLVNIMSNDVHRFNAVLISLHYVWIMPFQIVLICYLAYLQVNIAAIVGVVTVFLQTVPMQALFIKWYSKLRLKIAEKTDERVRLMHEIIRGIQVIKMYAWEKPFEKAISLARSREMSKITTVSYLRGFGMGCMVITERSALCNTLFLYSLMGNPISAAIVFSLAQFYNKIQETISFHLPSALSMGAECLVTIDRIEDFLMLDEFRDESHNSTELNNKIVGLYKSVELHAHDNKAFEESGNVDAPINVNHSIQIDNVTATWTKDHNMFSNMTLMVENGKLYAITGTVGAGKSSLLHLILKEMPVQKGFVKVNGNISYASQEPWLFVDTIKNNIIFGEEFNEKRYNEVIRVCALEKDFEQFPYRDLTLVGERGISLSGGQKARVNLARTIYKEADIYLLDDPLSAVDTDVGSHLFQHSIKSFLKDKTTILVTHHLQYLETVDCVVVLHNGEIEHVGTYVELLELGKEFTSIFANYGDENSNENDNEDSIETVNNIVKKDVVPHTFEKDENISAQTEVFEETRTGQSILSIFFQYWKAGKCILLIITMSVIMVLGQVATTMCDYWVAFWSSQYAPTNDSPKPSPYAFNHRNNELENVTSNGNSSVFDIHKNIGPFNTVEYLTIYSIILTVCVVLIILRSVVFYATSMRCSTGLHNDMFHKILRTKMKFYNDNPSGRILNRFSKDMGTIDEHIPQLMLQGVQIILVFFSVLFLISISNAWLILPAFVLIVLSWLGLRMYFVTAQSIKILETTKRSPVYSHVTSSLNGIVTIRALNAQQMLIKDFDNRQDIHTSAYDSYLVFTCTLGFWLDFICILFLASICYVFINYDFGSSSSNLGLALSQTLILLGMLQYGMRLLTETFIEMTSVERVLNYTTLKEEENVKQTGEKKMWPTLGDVVFSHVNLRYSEDEDPILKNISFNIKGGFKVGIVGRTGAGKSSLISALFRLAEIEGKIEIDGVDTKSLSLENIRSNISIIPQDPVLFSATIRYNLDPLEKYDDARIWSSLDDVGLKSRISSLDYMISEDGGNLSIGQKQLVCLARAILQNNKILVMDEATANVDHQTDFFIQKTIKEKFSNSTVLTIAHRLNTIIDSDRILVIDNGCVAEFDKPYNLLQNENGHFYKIVHQSGSKMAKNLVNIAKETYYNNI